MHAYIYLIFSTYTGCRHLR